MPTITISEDLYRKLERNAARLNVSVEGLVTPIIEQAAQEPVSEVLTGAEWLAEWERWKADAIRRATRFPSGHTVDDSREAIYEERLRRQM